MIRFSKIPANLQALVNDYNNAGDFINFKGKALPRMRASMLSSLFKYGSLERRKPKKNTNFMSPLTKGVKFEELLRDRIVTKFLNGIGIGWKNIKQLTVCIDKDLTPSEEKAFTFILGMLEIASPSDFQKFTTDYIVNTLFEFNASEKFNGTIKNKDTFIKAFEPLANEIANLIANQYQIYKDDVENSLDFTNIFANAEELYVCSSNYLDDIDKRASWLLNPTIFPEFVNLLTPDKLTNILHHVVCFGELKVDPESTENDYYGITIELDELRITKVDDTIYLKIIDYKYTDMFINEYVRTFYRDGKYIQPILYMYLMASILQNEIEGYIMCQEGVINFPKDLMIDINFTFAIGSPDGAYHTTFTLDDVDYLLNNEMRSKNTVIARSLKDLFDEFHFKKTHPNTPYSRKYFYTGGELAIAPSNYSGD